MEDGLQREELPVGFSLPYDPDAGDFRVYFAGFIAVLSLALALAGYGPVALLSACVAGAIAYHFYPLIEKSKPRFGANQYGMFVDGLGNIAWGAIREIEVQTFAVRSIENKYLTVRLRDPIDKALFADWRDLPLWKSLMKLPWRLRDDDMTVAIELATFAEAPEDILAEILRLRRLYGRGVF